MVIDRTHCVTRALIYIFLKIKLLFTLSPDIPVPGHARPGAVCARVQAVAEPGRHARALATRADEKLTCKVTLNYVKEYFYDF